MVKRLSTLLAHEAVKATNLDNKDPEIVLKKIERALHAMNDESFYFFAVYESVALSCFVFTFKYFS